MTKTSLAASLRPAPCNINSANRPERVRKKEYLVYVSSSFCNQLNHLARIARRVGHTPGLTNEKIEPPRVARRLH